MMHRRFAFSTFMVVLACCSANPSEEEVARKADELVTNRLARYTSELVTLRQNGLPTDEPINIGYSFYAGSKRRAIELQAAIQTSTSYPASIAWFKEPEQGWFVYGKISTVVSTPPTDRELLSNMVRLGLEHGCEIRWWTPERAKKERLSNYSMNPSAGGRPSADSRRRSPAAGYAGR